MGPSRHARRLWGLALLAAVVQAIAISQTLLPARDCVRFIRIAHSYSSTGLLSTVRDSVHHPLYPLTIAAIHHIAVAVGLEDRPELWLLCAQLAAAAPLVLLPPIAYLIGLRLFDPRVALAASVLISVLPTLVFLGADGLSDSMYLLFCTVGILCGLEFLAGKGVGWMFAMGLASGMAYLARPEGLVLPAAALLTLFVLQMLAHWRLAWSKVAGGAVAVVAGLSLLAVPYMMVKGRITDKGSLSRLLNRPPPAPRSEQLAIRMAPDPPLLTNSPMAKLRSHVSRQSSPHALSALSFEAPPPFEQLQGYKETIKEFGREVGESLEYVFGLLALVGLLFPLESKPRRCDVLVLAVLALFSAGVVQSAAHGGFISSRHVLTITFLALFWTAHGGMVIAESLARAASRFGLPSRRSIATTSADARLTGDLPTSGSAVQRVFGAGLFAAAALFCLVQIGQPRRTDKQASLEAARWAAQHTPKKAVLYDPDGWVALLSNRASFSEADIAFRDPGLGYLIVQPDELEGTVPLAQTLRTLLRAGGEFRASFPTDAATPGTRLTVYEWFPARAAERLAWRENRHPQSLPPPELR